MNKFPKIDNSTSDLGKVLTAELQAAGINVMTEHGLNGLFDNGVGELKTEVLGELHGWVFRRNQIRWIGEGPGINADSASDLYTKYGKSLHAYGDPSPRNPAEVAEGLACGQYHINSPDALNALAGAIRGIVARWRLAHGTNQSQE